MRIVAAYCFVAMATAVLGDQPYVGHYLLTVEGPLAYKDSESRVTFYVESDGRHIAAIDDLGRVLWVRDPFVEAKLRPYRTPRPVIVWIGAASKSYARERHGGVVGITFNSTQFGLMDIKTGEFTFQGQD